MHQIYAFVKSGIHLFADCFNSKICVSTSLYWALNRSFSQVLSFGRVYFGLNCPIQTGFFPPSFLYHSTQIWNHCQMLVSCRSKNGNMAKGRPVLYRLCIKRAPRTLLRIYLKALLLESQMTIIRTLNCSKFIGLR